MKKEEFKKEAKKSIDHIFARIDQLENEKDKVEGEAKVEYKEKLSVLKRKKKEVEVKYVKLVNASDEKLEEAKRAFFSATDSFKEGFSKIKSLV